MKLLGVLTSRKAFALALFVAGFAISLLFVPTSYAAHTIFDYHLDKWTVDGNIPAGLGCAPGGNPGTNPGIDFTDNYTSASTPSGFSTGTVTQPGDGFLHLKNPGDHVVDTTPPAGTITYDLSSLFPGQGTTFGCGDFISEATYDPIEPAEDQYYGMIALPAFAAFTDLDFTNYSMQMFKVGPAVHAAFPGLAVGTLGVSMRTISKIGGTVVFDSFVDDPINSIDVITNFATEVTGDVVFRMTWDDSLNEMIGSYSLDGGTSFNTFPTGTVLPNCTPCGAQCGISCFPGLVVAAFADPITLDFPIPALPVRGVAAFLLLTAGGALVVWRRRSRAMNG